ncbi:MAG: hypothetical protein U0931_29420 [Vulcanimicrobiota bacterium]
MLKRIFSAILWLCLCLCLGADPSGWQGTQDQSGAELTRPQFRAEAPIVGTEGTTGTGITTVDAGIRAGFDDEEFTARSDEQVRELVNRVASDWEVEPVPISLGDYKGYLAETQVTYSPGAWTGGGFRHAGVSAAGRGWLTNGEYVFRVEYWVGGDGVYNNAHQELMLAQGRAAQEEAKSLLLGLRPYRAGQARSQPEPQLPEPSLPPGSGNQPPAAPVPPQEIPWATLVGVGTGALVLAAVAAAFKKRPTVPGPAVATAVKPAAALAPAPPPAVYVLQVSRDHLELSQDVSIPLTVNVWRVDPVARTYLPAAEASIQVTPRPLVPELQMQTRAGPGSLLCQLRLSGVCKQASGQLLVEASAAGSKHQCPIEWVSQESSQFLLEVHSSFQEGR